MANALASTLDDGSLKALSETPAGRELLDVLRTGAQHRFENMSDALNAEARSSSHWLDHFADQVVHAQVLDAVSLTRASAW
jgi:hypothetical protein